MAASARFEPDAVAAASFPVGRRGYDTDEVRTYLRALSAELARLRRECDELRAHVDARPREPLVLDEATVAQALGEEAARVLTTARDASAQIRARAEEAAAALVDEANVDAAQTRQHADVEAARLRQDAVADAEAEVAAAKAEGREMVAEARAVRERMLADVQRRREVAKAQLEQLRLGHERVLGTFELAADALATVTADLRALVPDVRRNSAVDTGPVPSVLGSAVSVDPEDAFGRLGELVEAPEPPPAVHISVPARAAAPAPVDPADEVVDEPDPEPSVLRSAFSLGEVATPEPDLTAPDLTEPDLTEPDLTEMVAAVIEPEARGDQDDRHVDLHDDDVHDDGVPRPSADDLFARIRAARSAVTDEVARAAASGEAAAAAPVSVLVADPDVDVVAVRNEALAPVEAALTRRLKRVLADEQNEVLDRLRRKNPVLALDALVGTIDEHAAAYERALRDEIGPAVTAGARSLRPELTDDEVARHAGAVVTTVLAAVRDDVVAPMRERLARLLDHAGDAGGVTDGVRTLYREWKTQKLDASARHLAVAAHGQAAYAVLVPGTSVCWAVDPSQPCPDGEDNALGGPTPAGEPFPTGHRSAPAYVGCRCALAPAAR